MGYFTELKYMFTLLFYVHLDEYEASQPWKTSESFCPEHSSLEENFSSEQPLERIARLGQNVFEFTRRVAVLDL